MKRKWRKLHNKELNDFISLTQYCSDDKIENEMGRACSTYGERMSVYRALLGKPEGKRPLGRPRRRWEDNIKMIFRKWDVGVRTGMSWRRKGTEGGYF